MIVVTDFLSILNQMEFHLGHNRKKTVTTITSSSIQFVFFCILFNTYSDNGTHRSFVLFWLSYWYNQNSINSLQLKRTMFTNSDSRKKNHINSKLNTRKISLCINIYIFLYKYIFICISVKRSRAIYWFI